MKREQIAYLRSGSSSPSASAPRRKTRRNTSAGQRPSASSTSSSGKTLLKEMVSFERRREEGREKEGLNAQRSHSSWIGIAGFWTFTATFLPSLVVARYT